MSKKENKVNVIYIGGAARSGSTIIGELLGSLDNACLVGELRHAWQAFKNNRTCACGVEVQECPLWIDVSRSAFGDRHKLFEGAADRMLTLQHQISRWRLWRASFLKHSKKRLTKAEKEYIENWSRLYLAIQEVSGKDFIIDTSKSFSHFSNLLQANDFTIHVVHLVRDSRAVAYSWQRKKENPFWMGQQRYMPRLSLAQSSIRWLTVNLNFDLFRERTETYQLIRYEDVMDNPQQDLSKIIDRLCMEEKLNFLNKREFTKPVMHSVSGNAIRFDISNITLKPDEAWKHNLSSLKKTFTTLLTLPLLWKYNYL